MRWSGRQILERVIFTVVVLGIAWWMLDVYRMVQPDVSTRDLSVSVDDPLLGAQPDLWETRDLLAGYWTFGETNWQMVVDRDLSRDEADSEFESSYAKSAEIHSEQSELERIAIGLLRIRGQRVPVEGDWEILQWKPAAGVVRAAIDPATDRLAEVRVMWPADGGRFAVLSLRPMAADDAVSDQKPAAPRVLEGDRIERVAGRWNDQNKPLCEVFHVRKSFAEVAADLENAGWVVETIEGDVLSEASLLCRRDAERISLWNQTLDDESLLVIVFHVASLADALINE